MTKLERVLADVASSADGTKRAVNTAYPAKLLAVLDFKIRVGVTVGPAGDEGLLVDLADWRDVADLDGWRGICVWDAGTNEAIA